MAVITTSNMENLLDELKGRLLGEDESEDDTPDYYSVIDGVVSYTAYSVQDAASNYVDYLSNTDESLSENETLNTFTETTFKTTEFTDASEYTDKRVFTLTGESLETGEDPTISKYTYVRESKGKNTEGSTSKNVYLESATFTAQYNPLTPNFGIQVTAYTYKSSQTSYPNYPSNTTKKDITSYSEDFKGDIYYNNGSYSGIVKSITLQANENEKGSAELGYSDRVVGTSKFNLTSKDGLYVVDGVTDSIEGTINSLVYSSVGTAYQLSEDALISSKYNESYSATDANSALVDVWSKVLSGEVGEYALYDALLSGADKISTIATEGAYLYAGAGADTITGGIGADTLIGQSGRDQINGGDGGDTIDGGTNADILTGGKGADAFFIYSGDSGMTATTTDIIKDFKTVEDKIWLFNDAIDGDEGNYLEGTVASKNFYQASVAANKAFSAEDGINLDYVFQFDKSNGYLFIDSDNDHIADMAITLTGLNSAAKFSADDIDGYL